jgi:hypothetical protein
MGQLVRRFETQRDGTLRDWCGSWCAGMAWSFKCLCCSRATHLTPYTLSDLPETGTAGETKKAHDHANGYGLSGQLGHEFLTDSPALSVDRLSTAKKHA